MASGSTAHLTLEHMTVTHGADLTRREADRETVIVILSGTVVVSVGGQSFELSRTSVFDAPASAVLVPVDTEFSVSASTPSEVALCLGEADSRGEIRFIGPADVQCRAVGKAAYQRRVCDIVGPGVPAQHLVLGETFNEPGKWSSYPPHKHDEDRLPEEVSMEEIYLFKVDPPEGFGVQRLYSPKDGYDKAVVLRDGCIVPIPGGYHPVGAAPGCSLYYLWVLWGEKRVLAPFDDPEFESVKARLAEETRD